MSEKKTTTSCSLIRVPGGFMNHKLWAGKVRCVFPSSLYSPMRNLDKMTIAKMHPSLLSYNSLNMSHIIWLILFSKTSIIWNKTHLRFRYFWIKSWSMESSLSRYLSNKECLSRNRCNFAAFIFATKNSKFIKSFKR